MSSLIKFWISSTLILFVLAIWPLMQFSKTGSTATELDFGQEAKLVDYFCLGRIPMGGKAVSPKAWEEVLGAEIKLRESAGEAAGDAGIPREQSDKLTKLKPGEGIIHVDKNEAHYVMRSGQGRDWYLVITEKNSNGLISSSAAGNKSPSSVALAIGFALVGGGLMTLLARVAFGKTPNTT